MQKLFYSTIQKAASYELTKIKGSRFIGDLFHVTNKDEVEAALKEVKKQHPGATHHCFAYRYEVLVNPDIFGERVISTKHNHASDDGEPANTAGRPIMQILEKSNIANALLVVTRYFGGTKLGVGGLIQAYGECAKQTLAHAPIIQAEIVKQLQFSHSFDLTQAVRNLMSKYQAKVLEERDDKEVRLRIELNQGAVQEFMEKMKDISKGKIDFDR